MQMSVQPTFKSGTNCCAIKHNTEKMLSNATITLLRILVGCSLRLILTSALHDYHGLRERSVQENDDKVGRVDKFMLYNAVTGKPILTLTNDMVVNIATMDTVSFAIVVTTIGPVESVQFGYNGQSNYHVESTLPFALCGDQNRNLSACSILKVGVQQNLTATPYSDNGATGRIGSRTTLSFRIVNIPSAAPTKSPIRKPTNSPTRKPTNSNASCKIPRFVNNWESFTPDYPLDTDEAQADMVGNVIVSIGGFTNDFTRTTNRTYSRDVSITSKTWRRMDDMPLAIGVTHAATAVVSWMNQTKIYMCGGYAGGAPGPHVSGCFIYDHSKAPRTGQQWSRFRKLPVNGTGGGGMIYDSATTTLYYFGGAQRPILGDSTAIDIDKTWKFNLEKPSDGWVRSTPIPYKANHISYVTAKFRGRERHYFAGGQTGENEYDGNVIDTFEFVPSSETWIRRASMPYERGHTTTSTRAYGCGFIMAGGSLNTLTGNLKHRTNDIHYYDIPSDTWTLVGELPVVKATPKVFVDDNDYLYYVDDRRTSRRKMFR